MPGCDACEFRDSEEVCWCQTTGSLSICDIIQGKRGTDETRAAYRKLIHEKTLHVRIEVVTANPVRASDQRPLDLARIESCPDRGQKIGDGCNCVYECRRGVRKDGVSLWDCQDCLDGKPYQIGA